MGRNRLQRHSCISSTDQVKYDVQRRYKIEYRYERGVWGTAFKVTEAYLNAAEAAAMLYKENNQSEYRTKAQTLIDALRIKRFSQTTYKPTTISEGEQLVSFIRDERRRELCFENHRGLTYAVMEWKK